MKVAFITSETFTEKRHGGFGWLVRTIGRELVRRGFDVTVLAWRDPGYPERYSVDGVEVVTYPYAFETKSVLRHLRDYYGFAKAVRKGEGGRLHLDRGHGRDVDSGGTRA
jgi:glycogen synthase